VIADVLDHGSTEMTARYARLHDQTIRREVTHRHEPINIRGERIALPADGPLEEAARMKQRIARAKQALPERLLRAAASSPIRRSAPRAEARRLLGKARTQGNMRQLASQA
jgi:hypothetical protein